SNRVDRGAEPLEPVDLIAEAARRAADDAGIPAGALAGIDTVHVVSLLSWRYRDPGLLVAERLGAAPRDTSVTGMGGNSPQTIVSRACLDIQAGRADLVLVGGAEAWRTRSSLRKQGAKAEWTRQHEDVPAARVSTE